VESEILLFAPPPPTRGFSRKRTWASGVPHPVGSFFRSCSATRRTSIHRRAVPRGHGLDRVDSRAACFPAIRGRPEAKISRDGAEVPGEVQTPRGKSVVPELTVYWFVSAEGVAATHGQMFVRDAWNRVVRARADRWAYVLLQTDASDGEAAALARMQGVLDATLPAFQKPLKPARAAGGGVPPGCIQFPAPGAQTCGGASSALGGRSLAAIRRASAAVAARKVKCTPSRRIFRSEILRFSGRRSTLRGLDVSERSRLRVSDRRERPAVRVAARGGVGHGRRARVSRGVGVHAAHAARGARAGGRVDRGRPARGGGRGGGAETEGRGTRNSERRAETGTCEFAGADIESDVRPARNPRARGIARAARLPARQPAGALNRESAP